MYLIQTDSKPIRPGNDFFDRKGQYSETLYNPEGMHVGNDIPCPKGTPVRAFRPGEVVFAGGFGALGLLVVVMDRFGRCWGSAHLSEVKVEKGRRVRAAAIVGLSGNTTSPGTTIGFHVHHFGTEDDAWLSKGWGESPYFNTWPALRRGWRSEWRPHP